MPCRDGGPPIEVEYKERLDKVTRLLCELCGTLEASGANTKKLFTRELSAWWEVHKKADRARELQERAERTRKATRRKALKKLTPAERRALGIRDND